MKRSRFPSLSFLLPRVFVATFVLGALAWSQGPSSPGRVVSVSAPSLLSVKPGSSVTVPIVVEVPAHIHVNSHEPKDKFLKPLSVTWQKGAIVPGAVTFPEPIERSYSFSDKKLSVFEGKFTLQQDFQIPADLAQGKGELIGKLAYQACTESECYPPSSTPLRLSYEAK